ncbi:hypothetical protein KR100_06385 [Synechococcus sp. KORDI-100]|nr:hypothetical protein KR100_06385 [Synechococcus sp. KORDI-100]
MREFGASYELSRMFRQVKLLQHCHVLDPEKLFHQKQRERFMRLYGQK